MGTEAGQEHAAPTMISYAQNLEDVLLNRVFKDAAAGFYIDIGAYHPTIGSVTKTFYDRGWSGINVEPGLVFDELAHERPRDINVKAAVSDQDGEVDFFQDPSDPGMSKVTEGSATAAVGEEHPVKVQAVTLGSLVAQHAEGREINFLKIDAEGSEAAIIRATNWEAIRPQVLVIEATAPWSNELVNQKWEPILLANNYVRAYFDGINVFYVRAESNELLRHFQTPVNVLDNYMTIELWQSNKVVSHLSAERFDIIAERDRLSAECDALHQKSTEIQKRLADLTAAMERGESKRKRLAARTAALAAQLAQEQELALAESQRLAADRQALSAQLAAQREQADVEVKRLAERVAALSEQLAQERELARAEGKRLAADAAALSEQLARQSGSLAVAASRASRYDRLVLELRDEDGPRALRSVLPLARHVRRFHHVVGRDKSARSAAVSSSVAQPAGVSPPPPKSTQGGMRAIVKKGVFGIYKALFRPVVRPAMWRLRTFLLQPVFERMDGQRSSEIAALQGSASIESLRHEQAQLIKSLETLALTIASNPPREH